VVDVRRAGHRAEHVEDVVTAGVADDVLLTVDADAAGDDGRPAGVDRVAGREAGLERGGGDERLERGARLTAGPAAAGDGRVHLRLVAQQQAVSGAGRPTSRPRRTSRTPAGPTASARIAPVDGSMEMIAPDGASATSSRAAVLAREDSRSESSASACRRGSSVVVMRSPVWNTRRRRSSAVSPIARSASVCEPERLGELLVDQQACDPVGPERLVGHGGSLNATRSGRPGRGRPPPGDEAGVRHLSEHDVAPGARRSPGC
jgi:hypothetical protein